MSSYLDDLNKEQREAVVYTDGPSVILAGAGSGKTRVLISKVLHLIQQGINPQQIVMITFTNKAAREMKERIERAADSSITLGFVGTFHSFCCMLLRRDGIHMGIPHDFTIYDSEDQQQVIKEIIKKQDIQKYSPAYFLNKISHAKNQLITPEGFLQQYSYYKAATVAEVYHTYEKQLQKNAALDFDDLLMRTVLLFRQHPEVLEKYRHRFTHILVDEFQDTNTVQYALVRLLGGVNAQVTVVGDFSQSIYSWRGADIRNLQLFTEDYPEAQIFRLEQNYRSSQNILDLAYEVISANQSHPILQLRTENEEGEEVTFYEAENEEEEAVFIARTISELHNGDDLSDTAVLYRTNAQSRIIEESFLHYGIPYVLIGGVRFYERKEIKDILCYLRLLIHPEDEIALSRVKKIGKRRWDRFRSFFQERHDEVATIATEELMDQVLATVGYLDLFDPSLPDDYARLENIKELKSVARQHTQLVDFLEQVALVESEFSQGEKDRKEGEGVRLMTLHQAKGLEFDFVFISGLEDGVLPHSRSLYDPEALEEERRLFYVGITRARRKLFISYARRRFLYGRGGYATKSRFLQDDEVQYDW